MILTKEAIESITKKLALPYEGIEQDWELELSDSKRINEFVSFYKNEILSLEEKKALMALIFTSYNDYLNEYNFDKDQFWEEITCLVRLERNLFEELICNWSLDEEKSPENYFKITPLVRNI